MWHFLKLVARSFLRVLRFPPLLHWLMVQPINWKAKINAISTLLNLIAKLSLRTTWHVTRHVARDKRSMCCTWFSHECAQSTWAYVLETVHGAVRRLQKSRIAALNASTIIRLLLLLMFLTFFESSTDDDHRLSRSCITGAKLRFISRPLPVREATTSQQLCKTRQQPFTQAETTKPDQPALQSAPAF